MVFAFVPDLVSDINPKYVVRDHLYDDIVVFQFGKKSQDPTVITVNCLDKVGLVSDLTRTILEFGLDVNRADFCTDVPWCYMVFWVIPARGASQAIEWSHLKTRLTSISPSPFPPIFVTPVREFERTKICLLQTWSENRLGLLNDMTQALWDHELDIERFNALTTPDGSAVNIFCFDDSRNSLHNKKRRASIYESVKSVLGPHGSCELIPGTMDDVNKSSELTSLDIPTELLNERSPITIVDDSTSKLSINIDNSFSASHTLLEIKYHFRRGFLYDCVRVLKDCNLQIAHGRFSRLIDGVVELELLISHANGCKLCDPDKQKALREKLASDICDPVRVMLLSKGLNMELLIASTIERSGKGRPRLLYDVTLALKMLEIYFFKADNVDVPYNDRRWEICRFLFVEPLELRNKSRIVERVMDVLVGRAASKM